MSEKFPEDFRKVIEAIVLFHLEFFGLKKKEQMKDECKKCGTNLEKYDYPQNQGNYCLDCWLKMGYTRDDFFLRNR